MSDPMARSVFWYKMFMDVLNLEENRWLKKIYTVVDFMNLINQLHRQKPSKSDNIKEPIAILQEHCSTIIYLII